MWANLQVRICQLLLKKSLMENFIFCVVILLKEYLKVLLIFTILEILLFEVRQVLIPAQWVTRSENVKLRIDSNSNSSLTGKRYIGESNFAIQNIFFSSFVFLILEKSQFSEAFVQSESVVPDSLFS